MGKDDILVLVPGLDGTGELFSPLLEVIPKKVKIIVVRYPKDKILSVESIVDCVLRQIPKNNPITLIAESFAGPIALKLISKNQINIKSVIFCASFIRSPRKFLLNLTKVIPLTYLLHLPIPNFLIRHFCLDKYTSKDKIKLVKEAIYSVKAEVLCSRIRILADIDETDSLDNLRNLKCSYIQALDDKLVPKCCSEEFRNQNKNFKIKYIAGGHFILQSKPEECWAFIKNF